MKQKLFSVIALFLCTITFGQYDDYNTWSIEANGGLTSFNTMLIGTGDIYPVGYFRGDTVDGIRRQNDGFNLNPLHVNLGVRKMFSPGFGLKATLTYDNLKNENKNQANFDATYLGINGQFYININKLANVSLLWNRLNVISHFGGGFSMFSVDDKYSVSDYSKNNRDNLFTIIGGLTAQVRIIDRLAFTADISNTWYGQAHMMLDGSRITSNKGYIDASVLNVTGGLTYYLGKNEKHIDWYVAEVVDKDSKEVIDYGPTIEELKKKIKELEARPIGGGMIGDVNSMQARIKELEDQIKNLNNSTKQMMDANIIHAYFDFDKDQPKSSSDRDIQTVADYLKNNPSAKVDLVGHADIIGSDAYNMDLSKRRAENVKALLIKSGIDASRITTSWKGKDYNAITAEARSLARKVVFRVR